MKESWRTAELWHSKSPGESFGKAEASRLKESHAKKLRLGIMKALRSGYRRKCSPAAEEDPNDLEMPGSRDDHQE